LNVHSAKYAQLIGLESWAGHHRIANSSITGSMSGADSVIDASRKPFLDVATDVSGSLVYLDAGAAEVAQLSLGPAFLLGERCSCTPTYNAIRVG
jgi:hypothetical protein